MTAIPMGIGMPAKELDVLEFGMCELWAGKWYPLSVLDHIIN